jgi:hypothetical protein
MSVVKYKNVVVGNVLYASDPPKTKEIDGVTFIEVSLDLDRGTTFWMNQSAIKLEKAE